MNSVLTRINGLFAFTMTVLAVVTISCYLTTGFKNRHLPDAVAKLPKSHSVMLRSLLTRESPNSPNDVAQVLLDIKGDFTPLFDWNTKQLFLYVVASYETDDHPVNEVVLWDKIILRGDNPVIDITSIAPEYYLMDSGSGLRGNNVTLELVWNVIPFAAGDLPLLKSRKSYFSIPNEYTSNH